MIEAARALDEAHACGDWACMGELVAALAPQLRAWAAAGPLTRTERQALMRLRAVHTSAAAACNANLDSLAGQLAAMRDNKDGWLAYALAGDPEPA
jgi:hypothetical protein